MLWVYLLALAKTWVVWRLFFFFLAVGRFYSGPLAVLLVHFLLHRLDCLGVEGPQIVGQVLKARRNFLSSS